MNLDNIKNAKEVIKNLLSLGKKIQNSSPFLINILENLNWYEKALIQLPDLKNDLSDIFENQITNIESLNYSNYDIGFATGTTAMFLTASDDITELIQSYGPDFKYLLTEFENINPLETTIENIQLQLDKIDIELQQEFLEVKDSFSKWHLGFRSNSDLAKDARTFQEHFEGILNKLRAPKKEWNNAKFPKWSWNKMVISIGKKGAEQQRALMKQKTISENIWNKLTPVLKKSEAISRDEMNELFKKYLEHILSVINLIDEEIINQTR